VTTILQTKLRELENIGAFGYSDPEDFSPGQKVPFEILLKEKANSEVCKHRILGAEASVSLEASEP